MFQVLALTLKMTVTILTLSKIKLNKTKQKRVAALFSKLPAKRTLASSKYQRLHKWKSKSTRIFLFFLAGQQIRHQKCTT